MRLLAAVSLLLALSSPVLADDWTTADGVVHKNVKILVTGKDSVTIQDDSGQETIRYVNLPPDVQRQFGLIPSIQVKILTRAPIEHLDAGGTVTGVTLAAPGTVATLVNYVPVGANGRPQVILADPQGGHYRIDLQATDYTPPPAPTPRPVAATPPAPATNAAPPAAPPAAVSDADAVAASNNIVHSPGLCSYHAPAGWRIESKGDATSAGAMNGDDCTAIFSTWTRNKDVSLEKVAGNVIEMDKKLYTTPGDPLKILREEVSPSNPTAKWDGTAPFPSRPQEIQAGELLPFTTTSGWAGLRCVEIIPSDSFGKCLLIRYFFECDDKIVIADAGCHDPVNDHYLPIFDAIAKTFVQESAN